MTLIDWHELALFEDWRPEEVSAVVDAITAERRLTEGDVVCVQGERAQCWWIVTEGSAEVTTDGIYIGTIGRGETIGELALLDGSLRGATVVAKSDMVLHEVLGDRFMDTLREAPGLALGLARQLARRLRLTNALATAAVAPAVGESEPAHRTAGTPRPDPG